MEIDTGFEAYPIHVTRGGSFYKKGKKWSTRRFRSTSDRNLDIAIGLFDKWKSPDVKQTNMGVSLSPKVKRFYSGAASGARHVKEVNRKNIVVEKLKLFK
ncbi:MAG: hypothetical protein WCS51_04080 [Bacilli bacterium]